MSRTFLVTMAVLACVSAMTTATGQTSIRLTDVTKQTGIGFAHTDGSCGQYYILEPMSCGLVLFDYDRDGDVDIYFLNGKILCPDQSAQKRPRNALYRNDGNWKFTDVTEHAGVGDESHGLGATVGDYDNDGDLDLYLNNFGPNVLYQNQGDGTFRDVTKQSGTGNGDRTGAGTSFLDVDADGDLDLYVANYIKFSIDKHVPHTKNGHPINGGPKDYEPDPDTLFLNNGDGTFTDVSEAAGLNRHAAPGMGMVCADYDMDGDTDVFVANDGQANFLFQNNGRGSFTEVGLIAGFAYDGLGQTHASMGVDAADMNHDGLLDFHVTSFQGELATLYRNSNGGFLEDVTNVSGAAAGTRAPVTWGNGFVDFDNDGDKDIFIGAGHIYDTVHLFDQTQSYELHNFVLQNDGTGKFTNVTADAGSGMQVKLSTRGAAFDDLDNDGDIDVALLNSRREPTLLRNDSLTNNRSVQIRLIGTKSSRDAVGSKVEVHAGSLVQFDEVHSGRGYQGHYGSTLHFGIGKRKTVDRIRVHWHGGGTQELRNVGTDGVVVMRQE
ncbi:MAG: CRTAC1 family protein [Planctomycetales bacterium]|nr:CRTAC1 family protein [Planctomycetales bacterium]